MRLAARRFDLDVRLGAGAYICGEETSLLESLEGKRGMVRVQAAAAGASRACSASRPSSTTCSRFASVPVDPGRRAPQAYRDFGMGRSRGTLPFQLAGNIKHGGLVEKAFGLTLRELIDDYRRRHGDRAGRSARCRSAARSAPTSRSRCSTRRSTTRRSRPRRAMLGHGGIVVFDDTVDMAQQARFAMEFCAIESCGKCTPCRIGSTRGVEVIDRIIAGIGPRRRTCELLRRSLRH